MAQAEQIAAAAAVAAATLAGWSAWSSYRAAQHAKASAASAEEAVALDRDRRHDELAPRLEVEEGDANDRREGIRVTNRGQLDLDAVAFVILPGESRGPVEALLLGEEWVTEGDLGPLEMGGSRYLPLRRADKADSTTLWLRVTCASGADRWVVPVEVYITPPPMFAWR